MAIQISSSKQSNRTDQAIQDEIRQSLWNEETIRSFDINDISVSVENGQVCLFGHVSKDHNYQLIQAIARSTPGVVAVHNHLVTDLELSIQVARAFGNYEPNHLNTLLVHCRNGWVELEGTVPNREVQSIAEATAASVPTVRGVIRIPDVVGENAAPARVPVQPNIGVRVLDKDEIQGVIHRVVITPQNRLVTHAIVRVNRSANERHESADYLLLVEAMDVVEVGGISLNSSAPSILQFPAFDPLNFISAPLTWQPPYPYMVGSVRWPRLDHVDPRQGRTEIYEQRAILREYYLS